MTMEIRKLQFKKISANLHFANSELGNFVIEELEDGTFAVHRDKVGEVTTEVVSQVTTLENIAKASTLQTAQREAQRHLASVLENVIRVND